MLPMKTPKPERQKAPGLCYHKARGLYYVRLNGTTHYLGADLPEAKNRHRMDIAEWLARGCAKYALDTAAAVLGHAEISMSEHYAVINDALATEVMRRIG
jgi:hypothetical protein